MAPVEVTLGDIPDSMLDDLLDDLDQPDDAASAPGPTLQFLRMLSAGVLFDLSPV